MKRKVYFADLTYNTLVVSSDLTPLGCGYVAAYAKSLYGNECDIRIFKYPENLLKAVESEPPDIFAGSCYVWNKSLVLLAAKLIKEKHPAVATVLGGPAFPLDEKRQKLFFERNPQVDFFIPYDGEIPFSNLLNQYLQSGIDSILSGSAPIDGCIYRNKKEKVIIGSSVKRPKDLDIFPSPYLGGMLDRFIEDGKFSPMVQTTRGCPFTCGYCWASNEQNRCSMGFFSQERIEAELRYITDIALKNNVFDLVLCDSNFGLYPRDKKTIDFIYRLQQECNYPRILSAYFGKGNRAELVKNLSKVKGVTYCFPSQSTDSKVLKNIKRTPTDLKQLAEYVAEVHKADNIADAEIITGLPYETRETHIHTIEDMLNCDFDYVEPFTLMLLDGTELDSEEAHRKFKYDIRYRLIPRNFGKIDGNYSFEIERVVVGTNSYKFDDYIYFRSFHGLLRLLLNNDIYKELLRYIKQSNVKLIDWLVYVFEDLRNRSSESPGHFKEYVEEAHSELWNSPEDIIGYYSKEENYNKLLTGERGNNLMQKCTVAGSFLYFKDYVNYFFDMAEQYLLGKYPQRGRDITAELKDVRMFIMAKLSDIFNQKDIKRSVAFSVTHNITAWINDNFSKPISSYKLQAPGELVLELNDEQIRLIKSVYKRFNTSDDNLYGWYKASGLIYVNSYFRKPKANIESKKLAEVKNES